MDSPVPPFGGSEQFDWSPNGEWFAYTLKKLGRATLVGERTAGGAHPVDRKPVGTDYFLQVPIGQIRDPVDRGDFEGQGVTPDHQVASADALAVAHRLAVAELAKADPAKRADALRRLATYEGKPSPVPPAATPLAPPTLPAVPATKS